MILAGGVGERLFPLTTKRCKPAVPFGGNFRIIDFTLMNCLLSDLRRIHILTQYHVQSLHAHHVERWNFLSRELGEYIELVPPKLHGVNTYYRGTADAVYRNLEILDRARPDVVLVLSGDHVYRADYRRFIEAHVERDADATVLSGEVAIEAASSFGILNIAEDGRIVRFVEKPADPAPYSLDGEHCLINLGVYCFQTRFLVERLVADAKRKTAHDFGRNILPGALDHGRILACPLEVICPDSQPYWRDVGNIDSYFEASMDLLCSPSAFSLSDPRWPADSGFKEWVPARHAVSARIDKRRIDGRNLLASGVEISEAQVVNSILFPQVVVEEGAEIEKCILFRGARIGRGAKMRCAIVEEGVSVPAGAVVGFGGDAEQFVTSAGGVVVVSSGVIEEPRGEEPRAAPGEAVPAARGGAGGDVSGRARVETKMAPSRRRGVTTNVV
jgi:glucose-1-phosphate adenylyltransferase